LHGFTAHHGGRFAAQPTSQLLPGIGKCISEGRLKGRVATDYVG
jgi:hypothetical protein